MPRENADHRLVVRGTEILPGDPRQRYREKIARITLDSMVQFVGLLDAERHGARDQQGRARRGRDHPLRCRGKAVLDDLLVAGFGGDQPGRSETRSRARRRGEFVRWDTQIYGRAGGKETIIIDASLMPVFDDAGDGRVHLLPKGGISPRRKRRSERSPRRTSSCRACSSASESSTRSRRSSSPTSATSCARRWHSSSVPRSG